MEAVLLQMHDKRIYIFMYVFLLSISHVFPEYPVEHEHVKSFSPLFVQRPPFLHGLAAHGEAKKNS